MLIKGDKCYTIRTVRAQGTYREVVIPKGTELIIDQLDPLKKNAWVKLPNHDEVFPLYYTDLTKSIVTEEGIIHPINIEEVFEKIYDNDIFIAVPINRVDGEGFIHLISGKHLFFEIRK